MALREGMGIQEEAVCAAREARRTTGTTAARQGIGVLFERLYYTDP